MRVSFFLLSGVVNFPFMGKRKGEWIDGLLCGEGMSRWASREEPLPSPALFTGEATILV
jgi:hypothetical protein